MKPIKEKQAEALERMKASKYEDSSAYRRERALADGTVSKSVQKRWKLQGAAVTQEQWTAWRNAEIERMES